MRNFLTGLFFKFQSFMQGCYGFDNLSRAMIVTALIIWLVSLFVPVVGYLASLLVILAYVRCFSKNIYARSQENAKWLKLSQKFTGKFKLFKKMWSERKTYKYFKCKKCGSYWRIPRGTGKVEIKCRKCASVMIKKA